MLAVEIFIAIVAGLFIVVWALIVNPPSKLIGRNSKKKPR